MKNQIATLATLFVFAVPFAGAHAQSNDTAYCQALTDKYTTYVHDANSHRPAAANAGVDAAIAKCKTGDTAAGIPALEKALTDAAVALPKRG